MPPLTALDRQVFWTPPVAARMGNSRLGDHSILNRAGSPNASSAAASTDRSASIQDLKMGTETPLEQAGSGSLMLQQQRQQQQRQHRPRQKPRQPPEIPFAAQTFKTTSKAAQISQSPSSACQQRALDDVISISDAESDMDDGDEGDSDDEFPSISAILDSMATAQRRLPDGIRRVAEESDDAEVADSDGLASTAQDRPSQPVATTPAPSAAGSISAEFRSSRHPSEQSTVILPPEDGGLQHQYTDAFSQPVLVSTGDSFHPSLRQGRSATAVNRYDAMPSNGTEDCDLGIAGSPSSSALATARVTGSLSTQRSTTESSNPALGQRRSNEDEQNSGATDDRTYVTSPPALPHRGQVHAEEHETIRNSPLASQSGGTGDDGRKRLQSQRAARNSHTLPVKRHVTGEVTDDGEDEYAPARKRRKAMAPSLRQGNAQHDLTFPRRSRPRAAREQQIWSGDEASSVSRKKSRGPIASYEEWSLPDAVLKCIREKGTTTFQLQFTSPATCEVHDIQDHPATQRHLRSKKFQNSRLKSREEQSKKTETIPGSPSQPEETNHEVDIYQVECLLARWGKHIFLLKWSDGTTGWEPRRNILDKQMLDGFEAVYQGFDAGVDILATRTRAGKCQYLLRWHGRPRKEDSWVNEELLHPKRLERIRENRLDVARA